jgi:alkanesulfonate monooxygenase SsuD/methylene tetrahydromethanopterin reductase-like flavin-dependent oxidoreductase (luciferase family)
MARYDSEVRPPIRFGLFMSQAGRTWDEVVDGFRLAEDLGFDHGWLVDHLVDTDHGPGVPVLEAWTLLAALAARTSRLRLGVLVTSNTFRHPALLLKSAVTVDHVSGGRLTLGLGSGWNADEHRRYGIDLPEPKERVDRLAEAVELIDRLQRQERTTFAGRFYHVADAPLDPRPLQQPRIPLLIAAHRPRMLRLAAQYADQWDTFPRIPGASTDGVALSIAEQASLLDAACTELGRDPDSIRRSTWAESSDVLVSAETFEAFVAAHRELGFTDFTVVLPPPGRRAVLEAVARDVMPRLRAEEAAAR